MKRFLIKFCILFVLIDGYIALYQFCITPYFTGDMGRLGKIPFNKDYYTQVQHTYPATPSHVQYLYDMDSISLIAQEQEGPLILTIGDSFTQQDNYGYAQFLGEQLSTTVYNIARSTNNNAPEQIFVALVNRQEIPPHSIVIVESVERHMIKRLLDLNLQDTTPMQFIPVHRTPQEVLNGAVEFMTKAVGKKQTIHRYTLGSDCFSHTHRERRLYIYDSPWNHDGDFRFTENYSDERIEKVYANLRELHAFAEEHEIQMLYLVATDKYEVYEPFIVSGTHPHNPTLDRLPQEPWIMNTKPLLRNMVADGAKDVYYINDTHWSPLGTKMVGEEIAKHLIESGHIR